MGKTLDNSFIELKVSFDSKTTNSISSGYHGRLRKYIPLPVAEIFTNRLLGDLKLV